MSKFLACLITKHTQTTTPLLVTLAYATIASTTAYRSLLPQPTAVTIVAAIYRPPRGSLGAGVCLGVTEWAGLHISAGRCSIFDVTCPTKTWWIASCRDPTWPVSWPVGSQAKRHTGSAALKQAIASRNSSKVDTDEINIFPDWLTRNTRRTQDQRKLQIGIDRVCKNRRCWPYAHAFLVIVIHCLVELRRSWDIRPLACRHVRTWV